MRYLTRAPVRRSRQLEPLYRLNGVDGDVVTLTYREFHTDNWDMNPAELRAIGNLRPGETYRGGGGAAPEWSITRLHGDGSGGVSEPGLIYRYLVITKSDYDDIMRGKWTDNEDEYPESAWEGPFESEKLAREFVENEVGAPAVVVDLGVEGARMWNGDLAPSEIWALLFRGNVLGRHTMGGGWAKEVRSIWYEPTGGMLPEGWYANGPYGKRLGPFDSEEIAAMQLRRARGQTGAAQEATPATSHTADRQELETIRQVIDEELYDWAEYPFGMKPDYLKPIAADANVSLDEIERLLASMKRAEHNNEALVDQFHHRLGKLIEYLRQQVSYASSEQIETYTRAREKWIDGSTLEEATVKLTDNEQKVLLAIARSEYQDGNLVDHFVYSTYIADDVPGISRRSISGVFSSLAKKGLIKTDTTIVDRNKRMDIVAITAAGAAALPADWNRSS
jgi:hypothetical protein